MTAHWIVRLIKPPRPGLWAQGYFPRKFRYKTDAEVVADAVRNRGGEATVERDRPRKAPSRP